MVGRPKKLDKKMPVGVRLSPWLNEWFLDQVLSKSQLIEAAIISHFSINDDQINYFKFKARNRK